MIEFLSDRMIKRVLKLSVRSIVQYQNIIR